MSSMIEVYLQLESIAQSIRLVTTHENFINNRQPLVAQGIVEVVQTKPFIIKMENG